MPEMILPVIPVCALLIRLLVLEKAHDDHALPSRERGCCHALNPPPQFDEVGGLRLSHVERQFWQDASLIITAKIEWRHSKSHLLLITDQQSA